jgi:RNA binding exosome subunit
LVLQEKCEVVDVLPENKSRSRNNFGHFGGTIVSELTFPTYTTDVQASIEQPKMAKTLLETICETIGEDLMNSVERSKEEIDDGIYARDFYGKKTYW